MGRKRPERTERRTRERAARQLVRDREKLAAQAPGGSEARPVEVTSAAVVELRARATPCPQCEGHYRILEHRAKSGGVRPVEVACERCGVARTLWFKIVSPAPN